MSTPQSREELLSRYSDSSSPKYVERAVDTVLQGRVKRHLFVPSGRMLHTVVGRNGDEFVDPERPFCSCQHFFFSVLGGRDKTCYHLLANLIATQTGTVVQTEFHDEEFRDFLKLLSLDLLTRSAEKEDKDDGESIGL